MQNGLVDRWRGWAISWSARLQSGSTFSFGNQQLVGMTLKELRDSVKIRKESQRNGLLPARTTYPEHATGVQFDRLPVWNSRRSHWKIHRAAKQQRVHTDVCGQLA